MMHHKTPISRTRRISGFLGIQSSTVGLLIMVVLLGMGERMAERFLPIYVMALGGGAMVIGLLQAMDNLLAAFAFGILGTIGFAVFGCDLPVPVNPPED